MMKTRVLVNVIAVVALMTFTASLPQPTLAAAAPAQSFFSLSAAERAKLPDDATVTIRGKVRKVGQLRKIHQHFMQQIGTAATLGSSALTAFAQSDVPIVEPPNDYAKTARDMQVFCNAAKATICLYYPSITADDIVAGMSDCPNAGTPITICVADIWAEKSDCDTLGGTMKKLEAVLGTSDPICWLPYMAAFTIHFKANAPVTFQDSCDKKFWKIKLQDPQGAIVVEPMQNVITGDNPAWCVVRATMHRG